MALTQIKSPKRNPAFKKRYAKLIGKMAELDIKQDEMAKSIGINPTTFNEKLNEKTSSFRIDQCLDICKVLSEKASEIEKSTITFTLNDIFLP